MVQLKERGGGGEKRKEGFLPSPPSLPSFIFWLSFQISRAAKTGLSLLWNQTETLATQAIVSAKLRNPTQHNQPWGSYPCAKNCLTFKCKSDGTNFIQIPLYRFLQMKPDLAYHSSHRVQLKKRHLHDAMQPLLQTIPRWNQTTTQRPFQRTPQTSWQPI